MPIAIFFVFCVALYNKTKILLFASNHPSVTEQESWTRDLRKQLVAILSLFIAISSLTITLLNSYEVNFKNDPQLKVGLGYSEIFPSSIENSDFVFVKVKEKIIFANDGNKPICITSVVEDSVGLSSEQLSSLESITDLQKANIFINSLKKYKSTSSGFTRRTSKSSELQTEFTVFDPFVVKPLDILVEDFSDNALVTQDSKNFDFETNFVRRTTVGFIDTNGHQVQKTIIGSIYQIIPPKPGQGPNYSISMRPLWGLQDILH